MVWKAALIGLFAFVVALVVFVMAQPSSRPLPQAYDHNTQQRPEDRATDKYQTQFGWREWWHKFRGDPINLFTFVLAIATVFLGVMAIRADHTADRTAKAAQRSAQIAEQALVAGQRAFVSVGNWLSIAQKKVETGEVIAWGFRVRWYNAGNTPTRDMLNYVNLRLSNTDLPADWDFPDHRGNVAGKNEPVQLGIAPKGTVESAMLTISVGDLDDVIHERKFLHFWGWTTYGDVFPGTGKHVTRFAVRITAGGDPTNPDKMSFNYDWLSQYNCADNECERAGRPASWVARVATE
jgi:hypothetical protein